VEEMYEVTMASTVHVLVLTNLKKSFEVFITFVCIVNDVVLLTPMHVCTSLTLREEHRLREFENRVLDLRGLK
jgi:hypothetical protein